MPVSVAATSKQILDKFRGELGQHEEPANSNKTKYGAWAVAEGHKGMQGVAWCNIFISWGFEDLLPFFAYTPSSAQYFKDRGAWIPKTERPKPGDLVWFDFPNDGVNRISHIGIVEGLLADGRVATIEGNTNGVGSRTGGNVMRHNRSVSGGIVGYGRINYLGSDNEEIDMGAKEDIEATVHAVADSLAQQIGGVDAHAAAVDEAVGSIVMPALGRLEQEIAKLKAGGGTVDYEKLSDMVARKVIAEIAS
jgi:hypothetical protein